MLHGTLVVRNIIVNAYNIIPRSPSRVMDEVTRVVRLRYNRLYSLFKNGYSERRKEYEKKSRSSLRNVFGAATRRAVRRNERNEGTPYRVFERKFSNEYRSRYFFRYV